MKNILTIGLLLGLSSGTSLVYGDQVSLPDTCHITMVKDGAKADLDIAVDKSASGQLSMSFVDKEDATQQFSLVNVQETTGPMGMSDGDIQDISDFTQSFGGKPLAFKSSDVASAHWFTGGDPRKGSEDVLYIIVRLYRKDGSLIAKLGGAAILVVPFLSPCE